MILYVAFSISICALLSDPNPTPVWISSETHCFPSLPLPPNVLPRSRSHTGQSVCRTLQTTSYSHLWFLNSSFLLSSSFFSHLKTSLQGNEEVAVWTNRKPRICWPLEMFSVGFVQVFVFLPPPLWIQHTMQLDLCPPPGLSASVWPSSNFCFKPLQLPIRPVFSNQLPPYKCS